MVVVVKVEVEVVSFFPLFLFRQNHEGLFLPPQKKKLWAANLWQSFTFLTKAKKDQKKQKSF